MKSCIQVILGSVIWIVLIVLFFNSSLPRTILNFFNEVIKEASKDDGISKSTKFSDAYSDDAKKVIENYYTNRKTVAKCGNDYYMYWRIDIPSISSANKYAIFHMKDIYYVAQQQDITYADKLNGLEWKGEGSLMYKASRTYKQDTGWTAWQAGEALESLNIQKRNGKWFVSSEDDGAIFKPMNCNILNSIPR